MAARTEVAGIYKEKEGILLNKDTEALRSYKRQKANNKKLNEVINEVSDIRDDILELKNMFREFLSK